MNFTRQSVVLVIAPHFEPGHLAGGVIRSVANTIDSLPEGFEAHVATSDRDLGASVPYDGLSGQTVSWRNSRHQVTYLPAGPWFPIHLIRTITSRDWDLIYINSLWSLGFGVLPVLLWRLRFGKTKRLVVAPRGQLNPGALAFSQWRKRVLIGAYRRLAAPHKWLWHASSELERSHIESHFGKVSTVISLDPVSPSLPVSQAHASQGSRLEIAFVSRISPKKNLAGVLEALAMVQSRVRLTIAGPIDDRDYWARCEQHIERVGANVEIEYIGPVAHSEVSRLFSASDLFVFPTHGENFGHVVAESLAAACPVVIGPDTPWRQHLIAGAGVVLRRNDTQELKDAIEDHASLDYKGRLTRSRCAQDAYSQWRQGVSDQNVLVMAQR